MVEAEEHGGKLPKLVVFDLDATLWWPEMYMMDAPFRRSGDRVLDKTYAYFACSGAH